MSFLALVPTLASAVGNITRIQDYIDGEAVHNSVGHGQDGLGSPASISVNENAESKDPVAFSPIIAHFNNTTIAYLETEKAFRLVDVMIHIKASKNHIIRGEVGSGKSLLLYALLGEAFLVGDYFLAYTKSHAYCQQDPWMRDQTVKESITQGSSYDPVWFSQICRVCALDVDLQTWEDGADHVVGNKGCQISGGQRQRMV